MEAKFDGKSNEGTDEAPESSALTLEEKMSGCDTDWEMRGHTSIYKYQCNRIRACKLVMETRRSGLMAKARSKNSSWEGQSGMSFFAKVEPRWPSV